MKIIFLCGGLEPGRDGVGDYTRRLAGELLRQRWQVMIIAVSDGNVRTDSNGFQVDGEEMVPVLRISAGKSWDEKMSLLKQAVHQFGPDWVSLQYVAFSFDPKGLPFGFAKRLKAIGPGFRWHIMFHELWVGIEDGAPLKMKLWGSVQRHLIFQTIRLLNPPVIHTQTTIYAILLRQQYRNKVKLLPLFGNVPVSNVNITGRSDEVRLVIFGTIHPNTPVVPFIQDLSRLSAGRAKPVHIYFLGRNGKELEKWTDTCKKNGIEYSILNEQPVESISRVLAQSGLGITTNPALYVEKSGTAAAMAEHGLKVVAVAPKRTVRSATALLQKPAYLYEYEPGYLDDSLLDEKPYPFEKDKVAKVAEQFITDLSAYEK